MTQTLSSPTKGALRPPERWETTFYEMSRWQFSTCRRPLPVFNNLASSQFEKLTRWLANPTNKREPLYQNRCITALRL